MVGPAEPVRQFRRGMMGSSQRRSPSWLGVGRGQRVYRNGPCGVACAGHAVNPSLGARWRHPWRQRSCAAHPAQPLTVSCACQPRKRIKRSEAKAGARCRAEPMPGCCTRSLSAEHGSALQKIISIIPALSTHGVDLPCRPRSTPTNSSDDLSKAGWVRLRGRPRHGPEACLGRVGQDAQPWSCRVRRTVHTSKPRPSPQGRVYGVPRTRTRPAIPQEASFCCCF